MVNCSSSTPHASSRRMVVAQPMESTRSPLHPWVNPPPSVILNSTARDLEILRQVFPGFKVGMNMNPRLTHTSIAVVWSGLCQHINMPMESLSETRLTVLHLLIIPLSLSFLRLSTITTYSSDHMASTYSLFPSPKTSRRKTDFYKVDHFPTPWGHESDVETFPSFDPDTLLDSFVMGSYDQGSGSDTAAERLYFSIQSSQESLVNSRSMRLSQNCDSVLLPDCHLGRSYSFQPMYQSAEKPLPPTPIQPGEKAMPLQPVLKTTPLQTHQRARKRSHRTVTPTQLEALSRAVTPTPRPSVDWSTASTLQDSFSSTESTLAPMIAITAAPSRRRSTIDCSPKSYPLRRTSIQGRRKLPGQIKVSFSSSPTLPISLNIAGLTMDENPAYVSAKSSPSLPSHHHHLSASSAFSDPFASFDSQVGETSGWEPDSDDDEPTRVLRKKFSRKLNTTDRSRASSMSKPPSMAKPSSVSTVRRHSSYPDTIKKHAVHASDGSTATTVSTASTIAQQSSRSTARSSLSQSTTLLRDSTELPQCEREDSRVALTKMTHSPSIVALPGKKKVKFGRRIKCWLSKTTR